MPLVARTRWAPLIESVAAPLLAVLGLWLAAPLNPRTAGLALLSFLVIWPLVEWWMHSILMHRVFRHEHWQHHLDPRGDLHVAPFIPSGSSLLLLAALVAGVGPQAGGSLYAGLMIGYASYYYGHWCLHAGWWPRTGWFARAAARHALHHRGLEANYNVLLPVGDWIFGTLRRP